MRRDADARHFAALIWLTGPGQEIGANDGSDIIPDHIVVMLRLCIAVGRTGRQAGFGDVHCSQLADCNGD